MPTAAQLNAPPPALHPDVMTEASSGLLGLHDHPSGDFRETAGVHAVTIQGDLQDVLSKPLSQMDSRVIHAFISAGDSAKSLVQNLASAASSRAASPELRPFIQMHLLESAQTLLLPGSGHPAAERPHADIERLNDMLDAMSGANAMRLHPRLFNAASQAGTDPAQLLEHLVAALSHVGVPIRPADA